tara:strand:- start:2225 stop:3214 length:990 start_codon:yes stop_codon:yes gene_type:complete
MYYSLKPKPFITKKELQVILRKASLLVHPNKGGTNENMAHLQNVREQLNRVTKTRLNKAQTNRLLTNTLIRKVFSTNKFKKQLKNTMNVSNHSKNGLQKLLVSRMKQIQNENMAKLKRNENEEAARLKRIRNEQISTLKNPNLIAQNLYTQYGRTANLNSLTQNNKVNNTIQPFQKWYIASNEMPGSTKQRENIVGRYSKSLGYQQKFTNRWGLGGNKALSLYRNANSNQGMVYVKRNGKLYKGSIKNGKPSGFGQLIHPESGQIQVGFFDPNLNTNGLGVFSRGVQYKNQKQSGVFYGTFKNGKPYNGDGLTNNSRYFIMTNGVRKYI